MKRPLAAGLAIAALLGWFSAGAEWMREEKGRIRDAEGFARRARVLLWPPWRTLQFYVSHDGDEHLYFEWTRLILGERADLGYIAANTMGDVAANRRNLDEVTRRLPGVRLPYRDVQPGYPPVGLLLILAPRLVAGTLPAYRLVFAVLMGLLYLGTLAVGLRLARRAGVAPAPSAWWWRGAALLFAIGPIITQRFDLVPAFITACALLCALFVALGAAAKMYPVLLAPTWLALGVGFGGRARRTALVAAGALAAPALLGGLALYLRTGGLGPLVADALMFRLRPFQLESLVGSVALALGGPSVVAGGFGSHNASAPALVRLQGLWDLFMVGALVALALLAGRWAARRHGASASERALAYCRFTTVALLVVLCTAKVLSAQYTLWLLPVILVGADRRLFLILVATYVLTQIEFPLLYGLLLAGAPPLLAVLLLRNLLLVVMLALCLRAAWLSVPSPDRSSALRS